LDLAARFSLPAIYDAHYLALAERLGSEFWTADRRLGQAAQMEKEVKMAERFANGYALLIGVNENQAKRWALPDVAKDIDALAKVLVHPERCAYPAENVRTLIGPEAHGKGILQGLKWLQERIKADTSGNATAVVYYTGHGMREKSAEAPEFYLVPFDFDEDMVELSALRATAFSQAVGKLTPQRLLVVLDCCHAGGMGVKGEPGAVSGYARAAVGSALFMEGEEGAIGSHAVGAKGTKGFEGLAEGSGRAVLSSSTGEQSSYMRRDGAMSIFTYHLIEALTGHAQPQEGATDVLVSDVMSYVWRHVPESAEAMGKKQVPDFQVSGNFPVALLLGGMGLSKGQPAPGPLEGLPSVEAVPSSRRIDTGGGAYVEGGVQVSGGDFVGRDKTTVHGDQVYGDKVGGDKVAGDKTTTGDISGTGIAVGDHAQITVTQGLGSEEMAKAFEALAQAVAAMPDGPDRGVAQSAVQALQAEAEKGDEAEESTVRRWFDFLAQTAPDAWEVAVETFKNPIKGLSLVFKKVAERAKAEREAGAG